MRRIEVTRQVLVSALWGGVAGSTIDLVIAATIRPVRLDWIGLLMAGLGLMMLCLLHDFLRGKP